VLVNQTNIDQVISRIRHHDDEIAFRGLFYYIFPKLKRFAVFLIGSEPIAEEIASDVLIGFWNNRKGT
jgi:DNA-directed RNA polymerase specialized sigma24 family protein